MELSHTDIDIYLADPKRKEARRLMWKWIVELADEGNLMKKAETSCMIGHASKLAAQRGEEKK